MKTILITGVLGQDGSNLADYILNSFPGEYKVYGLVRRSANLNTCNIDQLLGNSNFDILYGDITDQSSLDSIVQKTQPDFFVNFAADSFVGTSWSYPDKVFQTNATGVLKCLESIKKFKPDCRFYSAGSSEEFGEISYIPQDESHPFKPVSPYGVAKIAARNIVSVYRKSYGLFAIHGTLFNHEGPRRGEDFVTRKITKNVAKIILDIENNKKQLHSFSLGNVFTNKDWSDSRDMVRGIWMMLNHTEPVDFILSSGVTRTIADFVDIAFKTSGISGKWVHNNNPLEDYYVINVKGIDHKAVVISEDLFRPIETGHQKGDYSLVKDTLGWEPKISFDQMVKDMIEHDKSLIS